MRDMRDMWHNLVHFVTGLPSSHGIHASCNGLFWVNKEVAPKCSSKVSIAWNIELNLHILLCESLKDIAHLCTFEGLSISAIEEVVVDHMWCILSPKIFAKHLFCLAHNDKVVQQKIAEFTMREPGDRLLSQSLSESNTKFEWLANKSDE